MASASDLSASYKARKEAFVSNLSGSSLTEINLVTLVAGSAVLLWTALQKHQSFFTPHTPVAAVADFLLNVCAILFAITIYSSAPLVLNIFLATPAALVLLFHSVSASASTHSTAKSKSKSKSKAKVATTAGPSNSTPDSRRKDGDHDSRPEAADGPRLPVRPFLTHYRGSMLVVTCLAILAVDFPIFPRRFAKVETWGTSLMDLGVGSFVFSAGVVSARALVKVKPLVNDKVGNPNTTNALQNFGRRVGQAVRHSIPLLVLGFVRLWSVKGLDYAEHVTEYGVHWNFFFTLALLPPFVELFDMITRNLFKQYRYDFLAVALAVTYELLLDKTHLLHYIIAAPRGPDLLSMNREGVFSFTGYLAIFLAGRGTGMRVVRFRSHEATTIAGTGTGIGTGSGNNTNRNNNSDNNNNNGTGIEAISNAVDAVDMTRRERRVVLRDLFSQSIIYAALYWVSTSYHFFFLNLSVSRRLANLPYVLWVVGFNNAQILIFGLIEAAGPAFSYHDNDTKEDAQDADRDRLVSGSGSGSGSVSHATSRILRSFNSNGLVIFLVANLLTGLVNLTVNTLDMTRIHAMGVLLAYAAAVTTIALILDATGVKIRI